MSSFESSEQGNEVSSLLTTQYRSPAQTLRPFYGLAEGIPSPKFSESVSVNGPNYSLGLNGFALCSYFFGKLTLNMRLLK